MMAFPPALIMILGALLIPLLPRSVRSIWTLSIPLLTLASIWTIVTNQPSVVAAEGIVFSGFELFPVVVHSFTPIFATIFALAAFAGGLFAMTRKPWGELSAAYVYAGGAIGVTFSGDLITLFFYWELMAVASTLVVLFGGTDNSRRAALRYAVMHFLGGVFLIAGIGAWYVATNSVQITLLTEHLTALLNGGEWSIMNIGVVLMLLGILVNAGAPPFSAWLPDAYPESSPTGAVFLSAFTTKTAVFVLLTLFAGSSILIAIGLFMVFYGIIYAMLENDMRRILSYSIINQVGFMITGIGIGTTMAQYGVATHAFCHIIYKALLLMSAGSVVHMTGMRRCSDVGGLYHSMRLTTLCGIIGALAISAFPFTSGFVSKSMITTAAGAEHLAIVWYCLVAASAGVFLHAGIKFPWFVFFQKDSGLRPKDPPLAMTLGMVLLAVLCIVPGVMPSTLYWMLPEIPDYKSYTTEHVVSQLQLLLFGGLAFFVMLPMLKRTLTISLDFDWGYRVFAGGILKLCDRAICFVGGGLRSGGYSLVQDIIRCVRFLHGPDGVLARNWAIASTVLYTTALLGIFLVIYYTTL